MRAKRCVLAGLLVLVGIVQLQAEEVEEIVGVWVNAAYSGKGEKLVWNADLQGGAYARETDTQPAGPFRSAIRAKQYMEDGSVWYLMVIVYSPDNVWNILVRISPDKNTLEWNSGGPNVKIFPAILDPGGEFYGIYRRK